MQGYVRCSNQRSPPMYREPPPPYQAIRNSQGQCNPQPYFTEHARPQQGVNRWNDLQATHSGNACAFLQNQGQYDGQTNQTFNQQQFTGYQQHYLPSNITAHNAKRQVPDNTNSQYHYANFNTQSSSVYIPQQNYRITGSSATYVGQQQMDGHPLQSNHCVQNRPMNQSVTNNEAQSRMAVSYNFQPSQLELRSNTSLNVSTAQSQDNQSSVHRPTQDANSGTYNINQNHIHQQVSTQCNTTSMPQIFNLETYVHSRLHAIINSKNDKQDFHNRSTTNTQPPDAGVQKRAANKPEHNSNFKQLFAEVFPSVSEPPNKQMNYGVPQREYWNKLPPQNTQKSMSEDDAGKIRQNKIQYITDPAECLEAVLALQKVFQQVPKAIAIVPPISQQTSNTEKTDDTRPLDSPPLKIDAVWSLAKEYDTQNPSVNDKDEKLSQDSSPVIEQDESKTADHFVEPCVTESADTRAANPTTDHQNDTEQSDGDSSDDTFDLSDVPVVTHTLEDLMKLVQSLEMTTDTSAKSRGTEEPESVCDQILNLYWNGDMENVMKHVRELNKVRRFSYIECVKCYTSVVFESITSEIFKKVAHCEIVKDKVCSSPEEFRSSWLNVDGQPADIDKVLLEPHSDYITLFKDTSDTSFKADGQSVKPDWENPADMFTPSTGNVTTETATENKRHSDAKLPEVTSLHNAPSEQNTYEKQGDNVQNHKHLHTKPFTNFSLVPHRDCITSKSFRHGNMEGNMEVSNKSTNTMKEENICDDENSGQMKVSIKSTNTTKVENIFDDNNLSNVKVSTNFTDTMQVFKNNSNEKNSNEVETSTNLTNTMQVENISDDENSNKVETSTNFTNTMQVENISDDENSNKVETSTNWTDTMQVENISDDENSNKVETSPNLTKTMQVENISDDENSNKVETSTNWTDTMQVENISDDDNLCNIKALPKDMVEDISNDENSSDESVFMDITVLSSEDAVNFFQLLEKESQCNIIASADCPELVASSSNQPNNERNTVKICSHCGTNIIVTSNSIDVTGIHKDSELFCPPCWDKAPLLHLEIEPRNETNVLCSPIKCEEMWNNRFPPSLKLIVSETDIASITEHNANEGLKEKTNEDSMVNSLPDSRSNEMPEIQNNVEKELTKTHPHEAKDENSEKLSIHLLMQHNNLPPSNSSVPETSMSKTPSTQNNVEQVHPKIQPDKAKDERNSHMQIQCSSPLPSNSSVPESITGKMPETLNIFVQVHTKIQPDEAKDKSSEKRDIPSSHMQMQSSSPPPSKSSVPETSKMPEKTSEPKPYPIMQHNKLYTLKRKYSKAKVVSDDCVLFTPDIVIKKNRRQEKNYVTEPRRERQDPPLQAVTDRNHTEKVEKKVSSKTLMTTALHRSNSMPEIEGENLSAKKIITKEKKKVKFALYGSKSKDRCAIPGRQFSPPATLRVSTFETYSGVITAKQKVHNQWSSTFIPTVKKTFSPKSPHTEEPPKKKPLKPHEVLKSNMAALKDQLKHRSMLLSSQKTLNG